MSWTKERLVITICVCSLKGQKKVPKPPVIVCLVYVSLICFFTTVAEMNEAECYFCRSLKLPYTSLSSNLSSSLAGSPISSLNRFSRPCLCLFRELIGLNPFLVRGAFNQ